MFTSMQFEVDLFSLTFSGQQELTNALFPVRDDQSDVFKNLCMIFILFLNTNIHNIYNSNNLSTPANNPNRGFKKLVVQFSIFLLN